MYIYVCVGGTVYLFEFEYMKRSNIFTFIRGAYDKFPYFFRMGTFINSTHMKL